ncbi:MAG: hypothetical protein KIT84_33945 [Labilithrix sp.]|nr:hypothetical protein [Labilithrix sp.]MCW5816050.1 hypothetical protein [Labilithrix sp.]
MRGLLVRGALIGGLLLGSVGVARADARTDFEKARAAFNARNWADAEEKLRALLDPKSGLKERTLISQSRMYLGASLLQQGKADAAKEVFEALVLDDPTFEPDPLGFPGPAIDAFIDVRSSLLEQIKTAQQNAARLAAERKAKEEADREAQRAWLEKLKAQAGEEKITVRHSRVVASLPFGVGQFQNDQPVLGWLFLGAQVSAIAGTAVTYGMYRYARGRVNDEVGGLYQLSEQWETRANDLRLVNFGFTAGFVGFAALGIVQAHIAFVPERAEKKPRELPPLAPSTPPRSSSLLRTLVPIVTPLASSTGVDGMFVGTAARF